MIKCFQVNLTACRSHLELPAGHRRYIPEVNLIKRAFVEQKRRIKVVQIFPNRQSCRRLFKAMARQFLQKKTCTSL